LKFYWNEQSSKQFSYLGEYIFYDISRVLHFVKFDIATIGENLYTIYFIT